MREHIRSHHSGPDPQHGTTLTPYYCSLCGDLFSVSLDLIHHLIEHSDRSTAAKRVQPTGPRKYKRRRKLNDEDSVASPPAETKYARLQLRTAIKQEPIKQEDKDEFKKGLLTLSFESYIANDDVIEFELPEDIFQSVSREKKPSSAAAASTKAINRPKMIFTEKTRVPVFDGKRKTRTMIQKQVLNRPTTAGKTIRSMKSSIAQSRTMISNNNKRKFTETFNNDDDDGDDDNNNDDTDGSETCSNEDDPNEDVLHSLLKRERKLSEKFTIDLVNDLHDILRSPIKSIVNLDEDDEPLVETPNTKRIRRQTFSRYATTSASSNGSKKKSREIIYDDQSDSEDLTGVDDIKLEKIMIDEHSCEICGDTFRKRDELLAHVPIHI